MSTKTEQNIFIIALMTTHSKRLNSLTKKHISQQYPNSGLHAKKFVRITLFEAIDLAETLSKRTDIEEWLFETVKKHVNVAMQEIIKAASYFDICHSILDNSIPRNFPPDLVAQLSREDREVISLYYTQQNTIEKISQILSVEEYAVKSRIFFTRGHLVKLMKKESSNTDQE